jgi:hypothetical protein
MKQLEELTRINDKRNSLKKCVQYPAMLFNNADKEIARHKLWREALEKDNILLFKELDFISKVSVRNVNINLYKTNY